MSTQQQTDRNTFLWNLLDSNVENVEHFEEDTDDENKYCEDDIDCENEYCEDDNDFENEYCEDDIDCESEYCENDIDCENENHEDDIESEKQPPNLDSDVNTFLPSLLESKSENSQLFEDD